MVFFYVLRLLSRDDASSFPNPSTASESSSIGLSPLHAVPAPLLVLLAFLCLLLAACVAGLTLGLMSLDPLSLDIVMRGGDPVLSAAAKRVKPIREQGNLLLVTLLFANTLATELLPLVLEALVPGGYFSLVTSVVSIMLFGEIIPQAICSRHPLIIGSYMVGFVRVLRILLWPVAMPVAWLLDRFLGEELGTVYTREELRGLIDVHASNQVLTQDETTILKGALEFSEKTVGQICTPKEKVYKLDIDGELNRDTLMTLLKKGHSRVPLYDGNENNIVCLLLVKQLVLVNPDQSVPIRSLVSKKHGQQRVRVAQALECTVDTSISDLLNEFQKGRSHMAIVYDDLDKHVNERQFVGIVSIEDIIEEILQEEIIDETDRYTDNSFTTKVLMRNSDGYLVRTNTITSRPVSLPGTSGAILVPDPELQPQLRADAMKPKVKKVVTITSPKPSQPLLSIVSPGDANSNTSITDLEEGMRESPTLKQIFQQDIAGHSDMRYAKLPSMSTASVAIADEVSTSEQTGLPPPLTLSKTLGGSSSVEAGKKEERKGLQVRPLPEDMTGEREHEIPNRKQPKRASGERLNPSLQSYGATGQS